ncbi:sigma-70 family RNA polymerase sigma factor [Pseudomonas cannabina]|uniref:RNA polymerase sigma-70 family protein n=1 Tax=Pseudomonas cannabina TaxID=86840 RepID=A0A0P9L5I1_PSECA|nr:sigma-70 family RNA polymerase sigma factor [Pseudomonas cannabina]KAA8710152.1 sigma-70 family RNA polymerase sigma factor [Pseudomonas cannabina]KPW71683.1 RNA polymerase sigma-70 family protein [Pseudomonas cannabina]RMN35703.1 RNA polymerase sigma-70 protein [Pseudomonas cannabina]SDR43552.1 RNA polymerase sigma-70 factor, ECF subfamily [Pseudomonas cannabina]
MSSHESLFDYEATLQACARGEKQALQRLYQQESARLLGVAQRLVRDSALAEDIVHDAFLKIWTHASSFDAARGSARGWIFSLTRHLALNRLRNTAREVRVDDDENQDHNPPATLEGWQETDDAFDWRVNPGRTTACMEQLEPVRRNCVLHAYVDGYSHQEIAQKIGAPLGTVKAWIKRSLTALRECMG